MVSGKQAWVMPFEANLKQHEHWLEAYWGRADQSLDVRFTLGWTSTSLVVDWLVDEPSVLARWTSDNDPVYEDSCVEVFIQRTDGPEYLNIECNAIGTLLVALGPNRNKRRPLDLSQLKRIGRRSSLGQGAIPSETPLLAPWTLRLTIPLDLIGLSDQIQPGIMLSANFYKCGDRLRVPHYMAWSPLSGPKPDFHRPDLFGTLTFRT